MISDDEIKHRRSFFDIQGIEGSLEMLCRRKPGWAANRLRYQEQQLSEERARADVLASAAIKYERMVNGGTWSDETNAEFQHALDTHRQARGE